MPELTPALTELLQAFIQVGEGSSITLLLVQTFYWFFQFLRLPGVRWREQSLFLMASPHRSVSFLWLTKSVITAPSIPSLSDSVDLSYFLPPPLPFSL